ncbi:MAG: chemotaxis protein CheW [Treponema sp.]|nr:chemotaxis protein CheW [Treponema sp.]
MEETAVAVNSQTDNTERGYDDDEERESVALFDFRMAAFTLAGKDYAIDIMHVKEIVKASRFTYVPNTVPFVLGVYNLRGEIIPIIDLRKFFNIEVPPRKADQVENLLIISLEDHVFGIVVDQIEGIVGIQKSSIQPPHPLFGDINIKFIYGIVEARDHLYVLLDIARIFGQNTDASDRLEPQNYEAPKAETAAQEEAEQKAAPAAKPVNPDDDIDERSGDLPPQSAAPVSGDQAKAEAEAPAAAEDADKKFVIDGLKEFKKFYITELNKSWFDNRYSEWKESRGDASVQFASANDADEFLKPFWSSNTGAFWTKEYADAVYDILPDNAAKQVLVWNPGCGKGQESFSLACVLKKRYPQSKIRIYAHETDLLNIANAPLLTVSDAEAAGWLAPYVQKSVTGEYTFTQEIKDIIMFEYHDINNANALPMTDIIFARDVISLLPPDGQKTVLADFEEKLKGNGILFLGENESVGSGLSWGEKTQGSLTYYSKQ